MYWPQVSQGKAPVEFALVTRGIRAFNTWWGRLSRAVVGVGPKDEDMIPPPRHGISLGLHG
jgi:hypothetical protein